MKNNRHSAAFTLFISGLVIAPCALPCDSGVHQDTAAERAQYTAVLKAAQGALPPAPAGWIIVVDPSNEIGGPGTICREFETLPWNYGFSRTYRQVAGAESRNKILTDQATRQRAAMEQRQPRLDAAGKKYNKLVEQQMALNQKGDYAGAEKLQPQAVAAQKEYEAILNEANDPAASVATEKAFNKDLEMSIAVTVNPKFERVGAGATAVAPPAGAKVAQRWHVEDETQSNDKALFLFGTWKAAAQGQWNTMPRAGAVPAGAHGISVLVTGDPARVTQTVASLDFAKLAAIVK